MKIQKKIWGGGGGGEGRVGGGGVRVDVNGEVKFFKFLLIFFLGGGRAEGGSYQGVGWGRGVAWYGIGG